MGYDKDRKRENAERNRHCNSVTNWLDIAYVFIIVILLIHLAVLQLIDPRGYKKRGEEIRASHSFELRGDIYDRNGIKLATDRIYYDIFARPVEYSKRETPEKIAKLFAPVLNIPEQTLRKKLSDKSIKVISVKKNVDRDTAQKLMKIVSKNKFRSISFDKKDVREYPQGIFASHVLGFYNFDAKTSSGVEYNAREKLEHIIKTSNYQQTNDGRIIYKFSTDPVAPTMTPKGLDVTLTIDAAIQHVCEKELFKMIKDKGALRGAAIVMSPKNGEILAYAVYPTYDPNKFQKVPYNVMKNWTLTDVYPPGSTFKIITVTSAMELGKINENSIIPDQGKIMFGKFPIKNHDYDEKGAPGRINLVYLFQHSSNVGSVNVGKMMSYKEFYSMLKKFGFGKKSGIDLPGESSGILAKPKYWDEGRRITMSYGYGTSVSIMQMVSAVSALANDGIRVTPHIIKYTAEEEEEKIKRIQTISPQTAKTITKLLVQSINNGNSIIKSDKYNIAAKTGTSRKPAANGKGYSNTVYTSTIGYFPAEDPQVLVYVVIDSAKGAAWGSTVAAPVFHEISEQVARILDIKPDKVQPATVKKN